ncbi:MAG: hypothetical protein RIS35_2405, partial [Pseudomonadota bacterium]
MPPSPERRAPKKAAPVRDERAALFDAADTLGLALEPAQVDRLLQYLALLRKWNSVYNLTAIRDTSAMLVQHLFDCLAILPALRGTPADAVADRGRASATTSYGLRGQTGDPGSAVISPASDDAGPSSVDLLADGAVVLDVGSGGGLPGVVLA